MPYTEREMALPPTIPTSFVPHAAPAARRFSGDFIGAFGFVGYGILGLAVVLALGVFFYGRILASEQVAKDTALAKSEAAIDPSTVEGFVRLRDRLTQSETLLNNHLALSGFFGALSTLMPATTRFTTLHLTVDAEGMVDLQGAGVAQSFNALAALSDAFAADGRIKNAIFSDITVNDSSSSPSRFTATLDPKLVAFVPAVLGTSAATSGAPSP